MDDDFIVRLWNDEAGASATEYALLAMLISMAIIAVVSLMGESLRASFTALNDQFVAAAEGGAAAALPVD